MANGVPAIPFKLRSIREARMEIHCTGMPVEHTIDTVRSRTLARTCAGFSNTAVRVLPLELQLEPLLLEPFARLSTRTSSPANTHRQPVKCQNGIGKGSRAPSRLWTAVGRAHELLWIARLFLRLPVKVLFPSTQGTYRKTRNFKIFGSGALLKKVELFVV